MVRPVLDRALFRVHWHWRYRTKSIDEFPNIATDPFCSNAPSMESSSLNSDNDDIE
jgi:hypothetical protein